MEMLYFERVGLCGDLPGEKVKQNERPKRQEQEQMMHVLAALAKYPIAFDMKTLARRQCIRWPSKSEENKYDASGIGDAEIGDLKFISYKGEPAKKTLDFKAFDQSCRARA